MQRFKLSILFLTCSFLTLGQVPSDYFANPLAIPLELSGTFGELRSNHFHSGVDIRTQQREGIAVYAPADGYVNRIKVAHFGYGKALYIIHPNGYSTVYGHLKEYAGNIQDYVKQEQYKKQSYEIELFPTADLLQVKKGDLIGYTGNTGSSGGPHLHYEIRDNASRPMNPLLFGMQIPDTRKPLINSIFVYPYSENTRINQSENAIQLKLIPKVDGNYTTEKLVCSGTIGFGISAVDQQNAANNRNGLYKINSYFNGEKTIEILFERFSFDETRYINRYIDYGYFKEKNSRIQKLFIERNNPLSIFKFSKNNGYVSVEEGFDSFYTIEVSDYNNNKVIVTIPIEGKFQEVLQPKIENEYNYKIPFSETTVIQEGIFTVTIPSKSLYEDVHIFVESKGDRLQLHRDNIPIHTSITISADVSNYKDIDKNKLYMGEINAKGIVSYSKSTLSGTNLSISARNFGNYSIALDTIAPKITPLNFEDQKWVSNNKTLDIKIEDNESGIKSYRATINDQWILTEYESKKKLLTYHLNDIDFNTSELNLKLIVTDNVGNNTKFEAKIFRK